MDAKYPGAELTEDWKKVLFNQFHDLAAGSGIGVIYKDAQKDYDVVRWSTNEISAGARRTVVESIEYGEGWDPGGGLQPARVGAVGRSGEVCRCRSARPAGRRADGRRELTSGK